MTPSYSHTPLPFSSFLGIVRTVPISLLHPNSFPCFACSPASAHFPITDHIFHTMAATAPLTPPSPPTPPLSPPSTPSLFSRGTATILPNPPHPRSPTLLLPHLAPIPYRTANLPPYAVPVVLNLQQLETTLLGGDGDRRRTWRKVSHIGQIIYIIYIIYII